MAVSERPIDTDELQAWIDDRLPVERRATVDRWLAAHPEVAARVRRDRELSEALREQLALKLDEPIPARLRVAEVVARRRDRRRANGLRMVASLALLATGALAGWLGNDLAQRAGFSQARGWLAPGAGDATLTADAVAAHRMFVAEPRHPVEVPAFEEAHLVRWLSNRLGRPLKAPDLMPEGFRLMGGRLLPGTAGGPAAQLMYDDAKGTRLTVYLRAAPVDGTTEFRFAQEGDINAFWWTDRGFGYAISAPVERGRLLAVAEAVFKELDRPPG